MPLCSQRHSSWERRQKIPQIFHVKLVPKFGMCIIFTLIYSFAAFKFTRVLMRVQIYIFKVFNINIFGYVKYGIHIMIWLDCPLSQNQSTYTLRTFRIRNITHICIYNGNKATVCYHKAAWDVASSKNPHKQTARARSQTNTASPRLNRPEPKTFSSPTSGKIRVYPQKKNHLLYDFVYSAPVVDPHNTYTSMYFVLAERRFTIYRNRNESNAPALAFYSVVSIYVGPESWPYYDKWPSSHSANSNEYQSCACSGVLASWRCDSIAKMGREKNGGLNTNISRLKKY